MTVKSANQAWFQLTTGNVGGITIHPARAKALKLWEGNPYAFLTADDPVTGVPIIWTRDERHPDGYRPFPKDKPYIERTITILDQERRVFIEKARQMMLSTLCCLYMMHQCLFKVARTCLLSRSTEKYSIAMLRDKVREPYARLPQWFKDMYPATDTPADSIYFKKTSSYINAVNQEVANRAARGGTNSILLFDEAAFQDMARDAYAAAGPATEKIFLVSTPSLGIGGRWMHGMIKKSEQGTFAREYMDASDFDEEVTSEQN